MKKLAIIGFLICILVMGLVVGANAQPKRSIIAATIDERGWIGVQFKEGGEEYAFDPLPKDDFNKEFQDQFTGETYKDRAGNVYPVLLSINKKKYVIRTSAAGNRYRYYLKS